jgi:hypothetical protein
MRRYQLEEALDEQRKRLEALYRLHVTSAPIRLVRQALEECLYAHARIQDMARKI